MSYRFQPISQEQAEYIAYNWHYEGHYSFYDIEADQEDLQAFLDPYTRGNSIFAVLKNQELVAFFSMMTVADQTMEIGLGMKPSLTGKGLGFDFLKNAIDFVLANYPCEMITLSVATFNLRAIKLYRKVGFKDAHTYMQATNGGVYEFLKMNYIKGY
ncbi:GNAT family N-acetyltransferase [Lysinibacillus fusiformis]|uniref:GNAT family N-acetyltransferase n=1 Tax=Lysinibacillus fusiformis TaxID=28031 RepID=UPI00046899AD|nr:GNAT family N-acetyltransferase [Lysinibacillus fusiformis]